MEKKLQKLERTWVGKEHKQNDKARLSSRFTDEVLTVNGIGLTKECD